VFELGRRVYTTEELLGPLVRAQYFPEQKSNKANGRRNSWRLMIDR
jgi:hypothetical protein